MQERLSSLAGIQPIAPWIDACRSHLRQHSIQDNEDEVLYQILHTDLRNVVRHSDLDSGGNDDGQKLHFNSNLPSLILRQAIVQSISPSTSNNDSMTTSASSSSSSSSKAVLPQNFRCMLQIEEFLDVSLNAEERLSNGPASKTSAPIGNQRNRCLKLLLSDGYFENGLAHRNATNSGGITNNIDISSLKIHHFVAMETQPIPNLSVQSKPGIKIILSGPIPIFVGVLMLDPSNTTVLGGCIPSLIPIQQKALSCAAKLAGVGIDPTFKALVWNPETGMEDENDEGEQASSDVQQQSITFQERIVSNNSMNPTPAFQEGGKTNTSNSLFQNNHQRVHTSGPANTLTTNKNNNNNQNQRFPHTYHRTNNNNNDINMSSSTYISSNQSIGNNNFNSSINSNPDFSSNARSATPLIQSTSNISMRNPNPTEPDRHPSTASASKSNLRIPNVYSSTFNARSNNSQRQQVPSTSSSTILSSISSSTKSNDIPSLLQRNAPDTSSAPRLSEYSTSRVVTINNPNSVNEKASISNSSHDNTSNAKINDDGTIMSPPSTSTTATAIQSHFKAAIPTPTNNTNVTSKSTIPLSPTALTEPLSFFELKQLLNQIIHDPELYTQYAMKSFVVPCKMYPNQNATKFNVEKKKNYKKSKNKSKSKSKADKYGYVMVCQMTGPNEKDGFITCKLTDDCIRPFLSLSAAEMKTLASEDKAKANKIANDCGANIIADLRHLAQCEMKLIYEKDEFFSEGNKAPFEQKQRSVDGDVPIVYVTSRLSTCS